MEMIGAAAAIAGILSGMVAVVSWISDRQNQRVLQDRISAQDTIMRSAGQLYSPVLNRLQSDDISKFVALRLTSQRKSGRGFFYLWSIGVSGALPIGYSIAHWGTPFGVDGVASGIFSILLSYLAGAFGSTEYIDRRRAIRSARIEIYSKLASGVEPEFSIEPRDSINLSSSTHAVESSDNGAGHPAALYIWRLISNGLNSFVVSVAIFVVAFSDRGSSFGSGLSITLAISGTWLAIGAGSYLFLRISNPPPPRSFPPTPIPESGEWINVTD